MALHVKALSPGDMTNFDGIYAIYSLAFPKSEQKPKDALIKMFHSPSYTFYLAFNDEKALGFCVMYHPKNDNFFLLEYMAIEENQRDSGIGSLLLAYSIEQLFKTHGERTLLVEIDAPLCSLEKQEIHQKREQFYRRFGFLKIDPFNYVLALKSDELPPPMKLLVYDLNVDSISKATLLHWLERLYVDVNDCSIHDPRIAQMLHNTPPLFNLI